MASSALAAFAVSLFQERSGLSYWQWLLVAGAVTLVVYVAAELALVVAGRRSDARALAGFIPDCVVLRTVLRASGESLLREHWPGPEQSLRVIRRLAYRARRDDAYWPGRHPTPTMSAITQSSTTLL